MKDSIKNRKKNFLALCLSVMMLSSAAAFASCKDNSTDSSSSSSSSSSTISEDQDLDLLIKNSRFETFDDSNPINTSVTGWSRSTTSDSNGSALASKAASGIIDLSADAWDNLTATKYTAKNAEDAKENWDKMSVKDKLAFYELWKGLDENKDKKIAEELDFYESFNIDDGDIPTIARFDTHHKEGDEGYGEDTKVLMIHNQNPEVTDSGSKTVGTGQKYTSSSTVTVKAGTSAQFSVWVRTQDLQSASTDGTTQDAVGKGAYISVTHSVGGTTLDAYTIENINTENMDLTATNGWKQYSFVLKGSSYTDTTFSLELGLGQGSTSYRGEFVNGYAFFDDIECEIISNADYDTAAASVDHTAYFSTEKDEKIVDATTNADKDSFALNFYDSVEGSFAPNADILNGVSAKATSSKLGFGDKEYTSKKDASPAPGLEGGFDGSRDITTVYPTGIAAGEANAPITNVFNKYFKDDTTTAGKQTLLLLSVDGVAYTAESSYAIEVEEYLALSFFVKTSEMEGKTGAGITLKDQNGVETSFSAIDTTTAEAVEVGEEDIHEGWQQCFFFVENDTNAASATFTLSFNFGPTSFTADTTRSSFQRGFAAFTDFQMRKMSKEEFASAKSGTYAKVVTIEEKDAVSETSESGFDTAKATPSDALDKGFANLQNYTGVYGDSSFVTGVSGNVEKDAYSYAGLVSKKAFTEGNYFSESWVTALANGETDAKKVWTNIFGDDTELPLMIYNDGSEKQLANAYGYFGKSTTLSANTYTAISLRVKGNGGKAYVRLIDTDDKRYAVTETAYNKPLTIGSNLTYWYDGEGNIWTGDPTEKATSIAFKLQTNGLYKANTSWSGYANLANKNAYYANLNAYEKAANGDLLVADGGASHDYNTWDGEGLDGIAYYYKDGKYYADRAKTIEVLNLADVSALTPRFTAESERVLETTVDTKANAWTYVTFYIHTADVAKSYRLEVWNGYKEDDVLKANAAGSYVVFDLDNPGTAEDNFTNFLSDTNYTDGADDKFESVFSYFDTASYLRYNASLDENEYGNLYKDNYTASENEQGFAFLKSIQEDSHTFFVDYQYMETAVAASEIEDDETEDSSTEDETESDTNIWLLISSLAIAGVLILAVASIVTRKIVVKVRKNRAAQNSPKSKK